MTQTTNTTLGDLISMFYNEFMEMYGDEERRCSRLISQRDTPSGYSRK